jgi:MSHA biogenesis protein MshQ
MGHFSISQFGFIRYSAFLIFWGSMSMSSVAFGEYSEYDEENVSVNAEFISIVYSGAAITMGAHSSVFGNIQSVAAVTLGEAAELRGSILAGAAVTLDKDGVVIGDITAGEDATIGAISLVIGNLTAGATVFIGAESEISGDIRSNGDAKLGASATVGGNATSVTSVTLGANAQVGKDESAGNVRAVNGPIVLGLNASVKGDATAGTIISLGMNAEVQGSETQYANPEDFTFEADDPVATKKDELTQKQKELANIFVPTYNELTTTIAMSRELYPGDYHASALTTTAGITLTFVGSGYGEPDEWLINIDTYISFGAHLTIELVDVAQGSTIVFNSGSYTTIGANSILRGTIFAGTYITTGENSTITGIGSDCGGLFATNGAITLGARSTVGALGCWNVGQQSEESDDVDEYNEDIIDDECIVDYEYVPYVPYVPYVADVEYNEYNEYNEGVEYNECFEDNGD